jgi:hypothetical protein
MLTFLSRSIGRFLNKALGRAPAQHLRALPSVRDFTKESSHPAAPHARLRLRLAGVEHTPDTAVAVPAGQVGASAFVAGQGARIYSLDAFRRSSGPRHPRAA